MKQKFKIPEGVNCVELSFDKNNNYFLIGIEKNKYSWKQLLPAGEWYIESKNYETREIILWNGLNDIQNKFEYKVEEFVCNMHEFGVHLNEIGEEGWELINYIDTSNMPNISRNYKFKLIFKRKII